MSSTILNLSARSPIDGTEYLVLATAGANWKAQLTGQPWFFATVNAGADQTNYVTLSGATTNNPPTVAATGSDPNIYVSFQGKGTGGLEVISNSAFVLIVNNASSSAVNYIGVSGNITGFSPTISAQGNDPNVGLVLQMKGSGLIQIAGTGTFTANGTGAAAITGFAPTGAGATPASWLTIQDNTGATRYIPCF